MSLAQELIDMIVDEVAATSHWWVDSKSLKARSLAARTFLVPAATTSLMISGVDCGRQLRLRQKTISNLRNRTWMGVEAVGSLRGGEPLPQPRPNALERRMPVLGQPRVPVKRPAQTSSITAFTTKLVIDKIEGSEI
ncbi:hypothetical protein C8R47DRAFT_1077119 [Mycena vitilis]|nr:hypothetical protein C8R47DRAFT_1077119 [Mycena vitilis]